MPRRSNPQRASGGGRLTPFGQHQIAIAMYRKGEAFLGAALLLRAQARSEAHEYVFRHLLCQSVELILKAALLLVDYDRYMPMLERPLGHNLRRIADEAIAATAQNPLAATTAEDLAELSRLYSQHQLRYGGLQDIFNAPNYIRYEIVLKRVVACVRLIRRKIN
jgi:hypothetical protein